MKIGMRCSPGGALAVFVGLSAGLQAFTASSDPTLAGGPNSVTVPFAPILGKPLHLHEVVSVIRVSGKVEQPAEVTTSDEDMVFTERNAAGYVLRWTTLSVSLHTSPEKQAVMEKAVAAEIGKSVLIQTDVHGVPVAVLNGAEVRELLASTFDTMTASVDTQFAAKTQAERDAIRTSFAAFTATYRNMTDDQLGELVLKEPTTLFGLGGATLTPGRAVSSKRSFTLPLINTKVSGDWSTELRDAGPDEITVSITNAPDPNETKAAMAGYFEKVLAGIAPDKRDAVKAVFDKLPDMATTDELVITVDAKSGLPRRATRRISADTGLGSQTRTESYSVVD